MRYYYLDALRSTLMMLGILYHTALIYSGLEWRVTDPAHSDELRALADFNHLFRMSAFFIIAGFFTSFSMNRHGMAAFLKTRAARILIPLIAATFTINVFQIHIPTIIKNGRFESLAYYMEKMPEVLSKGYLVSHLWFLYHLFFFYMIYCVLVCMIPSRLARRLGEWTDARIARLPDPALIILLLPLWQVGAAIFRARFPEYASITMLHAIDTTRALTLFPFFLFGAWLFNRPNLQDAFCRIRPWVAGAFLATFLLHLSETAGVRLSFANLLLTYNKSLMTWTMCLFCFALYKRWCDRPSAVWSYLSDASYTCYLFHQVIIMILGLYLRPVPLPPFIKWAVVMLCTMTLTLGIHHFIILRFRVLRLLYNGKWSMARKSGAPGGGGELAAAVGAAGGKA